eukprot:1963916-Rhodomonas_salina.2
MTSGSAGTLPGGPKALSLARSPLSLPLSSPPPLSRPPAPPLAPGCCFRCCTSLLRATAVGY